MNNGTEKVYTERWRHLILYQAHIMLEFSFLSIYGPAIFSGAFGYLAAMYHAILVDILGCCDLMGDIGETDEIIPTYLPTYPSICSIR